MSTAYRIWRLARRHVLLRLGMVQGARFRVQSSGFRVHGATPAAGGRPVAGSHPLAAEYRLLGAPEGADEYTIRRCYRERVRRFHPDRFPHDPLARRCAAEQLHLVNAAYRRITRFGRP